LQGKDTERGHTGQDLVKEFRVRKEARPLPAFPWSRKTGVNRDYQDLTG